MEIEGEVQILKNQSAVLIWKYLKKNKVDTISIQDNKIFREMLQNF